MLVASCGAGEAEERGPVVLAAASLQESLQEVADAWAAQGHSQPILSFAGTPSLARQVAAGAPADVIFSADEEWLDWLEQRDLIRPDTRMNVLSNRLALVAADPRAPHWAAGDSLVELVGAARVAVADTTSVPAGRYARMALQHLGAWTALEPQLVPAENARAALALVAGGEVPFGIVYSTDQIASRDVALLGRFPPETTAPIRYPAAVLAESDHPEAPAFLAFLRGEEAREIFRRHGFGAAP